MKRYLLPIAVLLVPLMLKSQFTGKYSITGITDSLLRNANAVMREDYMKFKINSTDNAMMEVHEVVTVLNESGADYLRFSKYSDKFQTLDDAEIRVYNAFGKELNKYNKRDMQNFGYGDGLVEDGKMTFFQVTAASYPVTVEYTYMVKFKGLLDYPDNYITSPDVSKEHFLYEVEVPSDLGLRYKMVNTDLKPAVSRNDKTTIYKWETQNLVAQKKENNSGPAERYFARIALSPNKFKIAGYEGDMTTWKNFGQFFYTLIGKDNTLSEKGQLLIRDMVKNAADDNEKARIVYSYLQHNMRYVSVQLGIGGWKPFQADFVQEKKYGDCKALSNYMQAALSAAGIKSYYAIVNAHGNAVPAWDDFATNIFNHVILCIPHQKDSTWLECTSATADFGVLGDFTENRKALLVTENGGVLVSTPRSRASENKFTCNSVIKLEEDGSGKVSSVMNSSGEFRQEQLYFLAQHSSDDQLKYLVRDMKWKHPEQFAIKTGDKYQHDFTSSLTMTYEQLYAFKTGSKMFLPSRLYAFFDENIIDNKERKQDYFFDYPYQKKDTASFELPQGFSPESLPQEKTITKPFGQYSCKYSWDENARKVTVFSSLEINQHQVNAADYLQLMNFKKEVDSDLNQKLVVKKD